MPDEKLSKFVVKQGEHVMVGEYRPLTERFRPSGGHPVPVVRRGAEAAPPKPPAVPAAPPKRATGA